MWLSPKPVRARVLIKGIRFNLSPMIMSTIRRAGAAALFALAIMFVPAAGAQTSADSTARLTFSIPVIRMSYAADSLRRPALTTNARRVWDVQGGGQSRGTARGAVIGGVVGGVLGAVVVGGLASGFCDAADCSDVTRDGYLAGGAIGALTGAAIGALIAYVW